MNKKNGLSKYRQRKVVEAFCADLTATQAAKLLRLNRNTVNRYFRLFRERIRDQTWPDGRRVFTPLVCLSLMIFFALACQCMSTLAAIRRETASYRWPLFAFVYMTALAWVMSFVVYQAGSALGIGVG